MAPPGPAVDPPAGYRDRFEALSGRSLRQCPHCHTGTMVVVDCIARPTICQPVPDTSGSRAGVPTSSNRTVRQIRAQKLEQQGPFAY